MALSGSVLTTASLNRTYSGAFNTSGNTIKVIKKNLSGTFGNFVGTVSGQIVDLHDVSGVLNSFSGTVTSSVWYTKKLIGSIDFSGTQDKKVSKSFFGNLLFGGKMIISGETFFKSLVGFFNLSGNISTVYTEGKPIRNLIKIGHAGIDFGTKIYHIGAGIILRKPKE